MTTVDNEVLVIGSGIAGLSFALKAAGHARVTLITKKESVASSTNYAQGGIAAVMSPDDSTDLHVRDTLIAGAGLCHRSAVERLAVEGLMSGLANGSSAEVSYPEVARWWSLGGWSFQSMDDAAGRYRLADGTGALIEAMVADGQPELRLGFTVTRIQDLGERVVVTGSRGESIEARCAIIALPMNCLPDVVFEPPLAAQVIEAGRERHAVATPARCWS